MLNTKHQREIELKMRQALEIDRARVQVEKNFTFWSLGDVQTEASSIA